MTDKPILFSGPMIRALLEGRKSQTRRVLKPQPPSVEAVHDLAGIGYHWFPPKDPAQPWRPVGPVWAVRKLMGREPSISLPYAPGDRLWARESFQAHSWAADCVTIRYRAEEKTKGFIEQIEQIKYPDGEKNAFKYIAPRGPIYWRPSIHMPRWASRLTLIVTDVRVQRLQEISEADARAEGALTGDHSVYAFSQLWGSLNADRGFGWEANPWVSATTFTVHKCNIDQMEDAA
ncbi:hypothetical protein [Roseovarius pacificus]|uniref:hypothetical protein n=1 Tax=Roseovarius pacificus TaxID=337701 RepID=UPI002A18D05B|nr:hypothetical protein [Roseovarius pacificus]